MTEEQKKKLFEMRKALDNFVIKIVDSTQEINENVNALRIWKAGSYIVGDVRLYNNIPYKCVQAHDSTKNVDWTPEATPALWMQYHGTSEETARNWIAPTGAQDMYKTGEYMVWTDGSLYKCLNDTAYSPVDYAASWEKVSSSSEAVSEWIQPTGASDSYSAGDIVNYNSKTWQSTVDNNVWEPGVYGWEEVI